MSGKSAGQAMVEYILVLAIVTLLAVGVKRAFQPAIDAASKAVGDRIDTMWGEGNLHNLRPGQ